MLPISTYCKIGFQSWVFKDDMESNKEGNIFLIPALLVTAFLQLGGDPAGARCFPSMPWTTSTVVIKTPRTLNSSIAILKRNI